jgi:hypothetical protein
MGKPSTIIGVPTATHAENAWANIDVIKSAYVGIFTHLPTNAVNAYATKAL